MRNRFTTRNQWFTNTIETTHTSGRPPYTALHNVD